MSLCSIPIRWRMFGRFAPSSNAFEGLTSSFPPRRRDWVPPMRIFWAAPFPRQAHAQTQKKWFRVETAARVNERVPAVPEGVCVFVAVEAMSPVFSEGSGAGGGRENTAPKRRVVGLKRFARSGWCHFPFRAFVVSSSSPPPCQGPAGGFWHDFSLALAPSAPLHWGTQA